MSDDRTARQATEPTRNDAPIAIQLTDIVKRFPGVVANDGVTLTVRTGTVHAIVGENGAGKSTLMKILYGAQKPDEGTITWGDTVKLSYVDQSRDSLDPKKTVWEEISDGLDVIKLGDAEVNSRAYCGAFNFKGADQQKKVGALSGGERNRVHLAKMLKSGANVLLLDEPTNNLDFAGLEQLEQFVASTPSAVVAVSHDREFLDAAVDRVLEIVEPSHRGVEYAGGWSDLVEARALARRQGYAQYEEYQAKRADLSARAHTQRTWSEMGKAHVRKSGENDKNIRNFRSQRSEKQAASKAATRMSRPNSPT